MSILFCLLSSRGCNGIHNSKDAPMPSSTSMMAFKEFCSSTSLHGWQYLGDSLVVQSKFIWVCIVMASLGIATFFLCTAGYEFINKVVVTTIDTTTASLQVTF